MRRILNNNGTSFESLRDDSINVNNHAYDLAKAMRESRPHGRDYQLNSDPADFTRDQDEWENMIKNVEAIRQYVHDAMWKLDEQRR